jgi:DNA-binding LacI/PurR family transcriptional regulator
MLEQFAVASRQRNLRFQIYHTHRGQKVADAFRDISSPPDLERIILMSPSSIVELNDALIDSGYRTVAVELPDSGYSGSYVVTDSRMAVHIGIDYLWSLGHRKITLLVNEPLVSPSVQQKVETFKTIAQERRVDGKFHIVTCGTDYWQSSYDSALAHMDEVWPGENGDHPTAIFAVSDPGAWAVLHWLARKGVAVPTDVSVLGFEGAKTSQFTHPSLSTIAHPFEAIARKAVEVLWSDSVMVERLAPNLVVRESTGPAPSLCGSAGNKQSL